jgi:steroid 5-alpha reductase family enzyme
MSLASERESWVDRWWPLLLILFGVFFVACLVSFKPTI